MTGFEGVPCINVDVNGTFQVTFSFAWIADTPLTEKMGVRLLRYHADGTTTLVAEVEGPSPIELTYASQNSTGAQLQLGVRAGELAPELGGSYQQKVNATVAIIHQAVEEPTADAVGCWFF